MTTLRTPPLSKLGIQLQNYRADRPDEWTMDELTRTAEKMALQNEELTYHLSKAVKYIESMDESIDTSVIDRAKDWTFVSMDDSLEFNLIEAKDLLVRVEITK
jgi:hypothetical protein